MTTSELKNLKGKRPHGNLQGANVAQGLEKLPETKAEVSGHNSAGIRYSCWNCGTLNYVLMGCTHFYCRNCWTLNQV
jgi:late competence protein required for DNA uptake (superfamily II DNA/RNA helicase)